MHERGLSELGHERRRATPREAYTYNDGCNVVGDIVG